MNFESRIGTDAQCANRKTQVDSAKDYYEESMKQMMDVLGQVYSRLQPLILSKPESVGTEKPKMPVLAPHADWINRKADEIQNLKYGLTKLLGELEI